MMRAALWVLLARLGGLGVWIKGRMEAMVGAHLLHQGVNRLSTGWMHFWL
jgi:hypothetical protein